MTLAIRGAVNRSSSAFIFSIKDLLINQGFTKHGAEVASRIVFAVFRAQYLEHKAYDDRKGKVAGKPGRIAQYLKDVACTTGRVYKMDSALDTLIIKSRDGEVKLCDDLFAKVLIAFSSLPHSGLSIDSNELFVDLF